MNDPYKDHLDYLKSANVTRIKVERAHAEPIEGAIGDAIHDGVTVVEDMGDHRERCTFVAYRDIRGIQNYRKKGENI